MAVVKFADGKFVIDDVYVTAVMEATDGAPERFRREDALKLIGPVLERRVLRQAQQQIIGAHFRRWPGP